MILLKQMTNFQVVVKIYIIENGTYKVSYQKEESLMRGEQPEYEEFDTYSRAETYAKDCLIWE